ncbi:hypothetical protein T10_6456 [Trichinella papuae]|uniref:Uncharacterized protein n=1 Tax=Trichinella papuae TaxID=268474 RepID=A0A0V1M2X1_9BILA|nr:hypothetical protein T10_6456 [Trichinella papuae]
MAKDINATESYGMLLPLGLRSEQLQVEKLEEAIGTALHVHCCRQQSTLHPTSDSAYQGRAPACKCFPVWLTTPETMLMSWKPNNVVNNVSRSKHQIDGLTDLDRDTVFGTAVYVVKPLA